MKRIEVRELQIPYTLIVNNETLAQEPVLLERNGQPLGVLISTSEYAAFRAWQAITGEPWPEEPPHTSEGDLEALAAVERIRTMFPPVEAETAHLIAEGHDLSLDYKFMLSDEG